jgi:asparagine synthase (glutamine-hydrolysing)
MCDVIRHRGPDDEGFYVDGGCAIGMRRLSIIDLNTGHQPIANEDRSVWIVFNGEIYNFQEIRDLLAAKGHVFTTRTDTEVLVHLYEQEGEEGFSRLRGMFAAALWDARRKRLVLVRDRFGKKPLYYSITPRGIFFGSELKCLVAAGAPSGIDEEALKLYFVFSYIPDPWSVYSNVKKLPPGSWMSFDADGTTRQGRYWRMPSPTPEPSNGLTEQQACELIREQFDESVRIRLISDVPLGAFLSGGIDSSSVVASMALQTKEPVKTFSIGFKEAAFNELPYARMIAERYKTEHHEIIVNPDSISLVHKLVSHFDEPFADSSAIPTYIVSEFAARHVKVVLSGDGGDELFAGYESMWSVNRFGFADRLPHFVRAGIGALAKALPYSAYGKNWLRVASRPTPLARYFDLNYAHYALREELLQPEWMLPPDESYLISRMAHCLLPNGADAVSQAMYFETAANLTGDMLVKVDRASMANSLEVRCPLLDHELAETAAQCAHSWKVRDGRGKQIFLKALGDRLPPELINRPKRGFAVPLAHWFQGQLREFLRDYLTSQRFFNRGIVQPAFVSLLLREHDSGRRDNSGWLWRLLMLELWFRETETA